MEDDKIICSKCNGKKTVTEPFHAFSENAEMIVTISKIEHTLNEFFDMLIIKFIISEYMVDSENNNKIIVKFKPYRSTEIITLELKF